jgi:hypothetical protein
MALLLSQASSYNSGNDLWIIANEKYSKWFGRLDWYLNFNLAVSELHKPKAISTWLLKVVKQCELDPPDQHKIPENSPLLIASEKWIPARWVAVHPFETEQIQIDEDPVPQWVSTIHKTWSELAKPSFRVFLPIGMTPAQFSSAWDKLDSFSDYTLVTD